MKRHRKITSLLLVAAMVITAFAVTAFSASAATTQVQACILTIPNTTGKMSMYTLTAPKTTLNGPENLWKRLMTVFIQRVSRLPTSLKTLFLQTDLKRVRERSSNPQVQDFLLRQVNASF